jgi:AcrR family transcriptional regulator
VARTAQDVASTREELLDVVERLFYTRGIQAIGMDEIRSSSGLPLKRIYQLFPGKEQLVVAYLRRRDERWLGRLAAHVAQSPEPEQRVLAVFDWLKGWFEESDFRGCAWINAYGELGATTPAVAAAVREHKQAFRRYLSGLLAEGGYPDGLNAAVYLLAEGAMVTAGIDQDPRAAEEAKTAATRLLAEYQPA